LFPLRGQAQFADDFTVDGGLNTNLWTTSSSVLVGLAAKFNSSLLAPTLSFDQLGMTLSGVNNSNELAGIQSRVAFSPPFTFTTSVTAEQAHGNAFEIFLVAGTQSEWLNVAGNLNPGNGSFFGVWLNYDNSGHPYLSLGNDIYSDPSDGTQYSVQVFVDAAGTASVTLFAANGITLGIQSGLQLGKGPFYVILGQREGGPHTPGPNRALWRTASLVPAVPAPLLVVLAINGGILKLGWKAVVGAKYQLQYATDLFSAQWNNLGAPAMATNSSMTLSDSPGADAQRLYRLLVAQ
jgi:hypothetical protein